MVALRPLWFRRPGAGECGQDGRDGVCTQGPGAAEYILIVYFTQSRRWYTSYDLTVAMTVFDAWLYGNCCNHIFTISWGAAGFPPKVILWDCNTWLLLVLCGWSMGLPVRNLMIWKCSLCVTKFRSITSLTCKYLKDKQWRNICQRSCDLRIVHTWYLCWMIVFHFCLFILANVNRRSLKVYSVSLLPLWSSVILAAQRKLTKITLVDCSPCFNWTL